MYSFSQDNFHWVNFWEKSIFVYMMFRNRILILFLFIAANVLAQQPTPPLEIPLKLSGTFGEFRPTHFHAGLDIKTQGQQGFEVSSIKEGSIRRIRVATYWLWEMPLHPTCRWDNLGLCPPKEVRP